MDDELREAVGLLVWELDLMYGAPACMCGCPVEEHIPVRRNGGVWHAPCRNCLCDDYQEVETKND